MKRERKMWAVFPEDCRLYLGQFADTLELTRKGSIERFLTGDDHSWADWRKRGYRCRRVTITWEDNTKEGGHGVG